MANESGRAVRVTPRGAISDVTLPPEVGGQLAAMRENLDCSLVQPVDLTSEVTMWCDEESLLAHSPEVNLCATGIAARHGLSAQPYVGTVLFTGACDEAGEICGLGEAQASELRRECMHVARYVMEQRLARPERGALAEVQLVQQEYPLELSVGTR
jgi:hypothetical protein